jgi:predicted secreted hydrolase
MNVKCLSSVVLALFIAVISTGQTRSQGFAGLGSNAEGFEIPTRDKPLAFPADHGPHPGFRIEWWYVTANLVAADGRRFGAQWTLFRSGLAPGDKPGWSDPQIWIGHAAVTTPQHQYVAERLARGGVGQAGVAIEPFRASIDDWEMRSRSAAHVDELANIDLAAKGQDFSYRLALDAKGPLVLQGDRGYSVKSASGQASYYYSQPFYTVTGEITVDGKAIPVSGNAWLDREWSSQPLASDQTGWDWFSVHFDTGAKLMAFRLRDSGGGYISANWITPDGRTEPLGGDAISLEPIKKARVAGRDIPIEWHLLIPGKGVDITTQALNDQSWMKTSTPYWEGPISIKGSIPGVGYLEMTGY